MAFSVKMPRVLSYSLKGGWAALPGGGGGGGGGPYAAMLQPLPMEFWRVVGDGVPEPQLGGLGFYRVS